MSEGYQLRGNRVPPLKREHIDALAVLTAKALNVKRRKRLDLAFENLTRYGITLKVVDDTEWVWLTRGTYDPNNAVISIPSKVYEQACDGGRDALFVLFHECGHHFLMHKALLHESSIAAIEKEDAEWQADTFANAILNYMGIETNQLSFNFLM